MLKKHKKRVRKGVYLLAATATSIIHTHNNLVESPLQAPVTNHHFTVIYI